MIIFYQHGGGARDIELLAKSLSPEAWSKLKTQTIKLLRLRKHDRAAELLETIMFDFYQATNGFNDDFSVLCIVAPIDKYVEMTEKFENEQDKLAFRNIALALGELKHAIRFIAAEPDTDAGTAPVSSPSLSITSDSVERALADTERLIHVSGAVSGVDRIHTAFHGYLRKVCQKASISVAEDAGVTQLLRAIRDNHPCFTQNGPRANDIEKIYRAMATIVDALNPLRNQASIAHPNPELLEDAEAMLVINSVRTLLHYLNARLDR